MPTAQDTAAPTDAFASWVEWQQETCAGGRQLITAVNHHSGTALFLAPADLDAARRSGPTHNVVAQELRDGGFLAGSTVAADSGPTPRQPGSGIVWSGAHRFVQHSHDAGLRHLFHPASIIAQILVALAGAAATAYLMIGRPVQLHAEPGQVPAIILLGLVAVAIHELGHALVTVHHGRHVRAAGLRLHLGSPAFYVESLDALLLTRRQRIVQAAAGPWAEWLVNSAAALALLALPADSAVGSLLHRFMIVNAIGIAMNLLPFVGLDGSLLLGDLIRQPDLLVRTRTAVVAPQELARRDRWIIGYALANAVVAGLLLLTAVFFWWQLFGGLVELLIGLGPVGIVVLVAFAVAAGGQVTRIVNLVRASFPPIVQLRSRLAFRMERRWRVKATEAFRDLPELAQLDAAQLGILAGRLQRVCSANAALPTADGHLYLPRAKAVVPVHDVPAELLARNAGSVLLPAQWRELIPS